MIDINNESGTPVDEKALVKLARYCLDQLHVHPDAELSVVLVDEETMAAYHVKFMDEEGPTDVLSFPMDELHPGDPGEPSQGILGDIVLCPQVASAQAGESHRTAAQELEYLLVHGLLHLLGFDHATPDEQAVMFSLNDQLIEAWGKKRR